MRGFTTILHGLKGQLQEITQLVFAQNFPRAYPSDDSDAPPAVPISMIPPTRAPRTPLKCRDAQAFDSSLTRMKVHLIEVLDLLSSLLHPAF